MSLPTAYLTSTKRVADIFNALKTAQAPEKFTYRFLQALGFKAKSDRLMINVLKSLKFLDDAGKSTSRYYEFLDQTQSAKILGVAIKEAYSELFAVNVNAHQMAKSELINKLRTLTQGQYSNPVLGMMAMTFLSLAKLADFDTAKARKKQKEEGQTELESTSHKQKDLEKENKQVKLGGLVYNIQIVLPETRDSAIYDALFKSLKEHIL